MPSMVDYLAAALSEKTDTQFEVRRGRNARMQVRYGLKATRGEYSWCFQAPHPMTNDELKRWLATINDMVTMGFIPVLPLRSAIDNLIEAIADARDRGERIPDWLDQVEDVAIDARSKARGGPDGAQRQ